MVKRILRRLRFERDRLPGRLLELVGEEYKYQHGMIDMQSSIRNMRSCGFSPTLIIDIGAYHGDWSRMAREIYRVPILMVEANPEKSTFLEAAAQEIGSAEYRIALLGSQRAASVPYYVMETGSSVLPEMTSIPRSTVELPMEILDNLISEASHGPYMLKLDVQGFELEVLRGADRVLKNTEVCLLEVALMEYNNGAPLLAEVVAFMGSRGFAVYDISGMFRRESDNALYMIDLMFAHKDSALRSPKRFWTREAEFEQNS
jgi:FkbM family methyltransferase